jgi:hypothetical protein
VDRKGAVVGQQQDDHLEQVPGNVGAKQQELRRVGLRLEVDHDKWMLDRVTDVVVRQPMAARRTVDIHTLLV